MEEQGETQSSNNGEEQSQEERSVVEDETVLRFLDSMDSYLTLMDSFSTTVRKGWLELASSRHSMGASRISSSFFDLKLHPAATTLQVSEDDVGSTVKQPHFTLHKWASLENGKCSSVEAKFKEDELQKESNIGQLRHWGTSHGSGPQGKSPTSDGSPLTIDSLVQKERSKSLSVFGTLVSPKLRDAQLSFETALETLVEIANMRSSILSAFDQIQKEMEGIKQ